jgi:hypothetical protein
VALALGVVGIEPEIQKGLAYRSEHPVIRGAHAGRGVVIGPRPLPHRPFQRPVPRAHQRRHHLGEAFTRRQARQLAEMAAVVVAQLAPRLHERASVPRDVGEMPVEAAFCHGQATT